MSSTDANIIIDDKPMYAKVAEAIMFNSTKAERERYILDMQAIEERLKCCRIDITEQIPLPTPLLSIDGRCICSRGNISAICGESKSKKTFLCSALVASSLAYPYADRMGFENVNTSLDRRVVWLDTEQGIHHVRKVVQRMNTITGAIRAGQAEDPRLLVYTLREYSPAQRLQTLRDTLAHDTPDIVVVDGIADLQRNTNDLEESDALVGELMALSTEFNCHIICVLHTNPGSDKARGHLGSSLQRKAESVLYVHKVGDISVVEPQFCRNEPFERFAFRVNDEGIPELCALPTESTSHEGAIASLVESEYGGAVERSVLTSRLMSELSLSESAARMRISRAVRSGQVGFTEGLIHLPSASICRAKEELSLVATTTAAVPPKPPVVTSIYDDDDPPF